MNHVVEGKNIAILAIDDFEEAELTQTKKTLGDTGANTTIVWSVVVNHQIYQRLVMK